MSELKNLKNKARELHRKALALKKEYQAAWTEHAAWYCETPERRRALMCNTLNAEDAVKHKEFQAKVQSLSLAAGKAKGEWYDARWAVYEFVHKAAMEARKATKKL